MTLSQRAPSTDRRRFAVLLLAVALVTLVAACQTGRQLRGEVWNLTTITQQTPAFQGVVAPSDVGKYTIEFLSDNRWIGRADCNTVTGSYTTSGARGLNIQIASTPQIDCGAESMSDPYIVALALVTGYGIDGDQLTLNLPSGGHARLLCRSASSVARSVEHVRCGRVGQRSGFGGRLGDGSADLGAHAGADSATPAPTPAPTPTPTPAPTPTPTPAPTPTPTPGRRLRPRRRRRLRPRRRRPPRHPRPRRARRLRRRRSATRPTSGSSSAYPGNWFTITDEPQLACQFFDPAPIKIDPATGVPKSAVQVLPSTTLTYEQALTGATDTANWSDITTTETTVSGGLPATKIVATATGAGTLSGGHGPLRLPRRLGRPRGSSRSSRAALRATRTRRPTRRSSTRW